MTLLWLGNLSTIIRSFQVMDCQEVDNNDAVKHSYESLLLSERYEIV